MANYTDWPEFDWDEERDPELYKLWICDIKETVREILPFGMWMGMANYSTHALSYATEMLSIPTSKGFDWRWKDGWGYLSIMLTSEEERKEREPIFRERIAPWIEDFGKEWDKYVAELMEHYNRLKAVDVAKASDIELKMTFLDWCYVYGRSGEIHMVTMYAFCSIYRLFEEICKELLGINMHDPLFIKLMGGFENKLLDTDRVLWRLGDSAKELGLERIFKATPDDEGLLHKLEESEAGRKWLQEFREFLDEYGWRTRENWDVVSPSWVEKPSLALPAIRRNMAVGGFFIRDQTLQRLRNEREEAEKEILRAVPEDKRRWFEKLMRAAQWAGIVAEEHVFYTENYTNGLGRRITKEIGKRFAQAGVIDDPQDIYYLLPREIGIRMISKHNARRLVQARRKEYEEFRNAQPPLFIGDPSVAGELLAGDPLLASTVVAMPRVKPELKADLYGAASAPGVSEGIARVIFSEEEFDQVQPGEILVTMETSAVWTPVFSLVKAVVTEVGGVMSHAYIVGREYGLPVVAGTQEATKKIKTGMRLKVDGDVGAVYILSE